jgi:hypothetical protein
MTANRWEVIDVLSALPETLRSVRLLRGKSLRQVADETGLSFSTVARIEKGEDCALSSAKRLLLWIGGVRSSLVMTDPPGATCLPPGLMPAGWTTLPTKRAAGMPSRWRWRWTPQRIEALPVATAVTAERERVLAEVEALGSDSFDAYMTVAPMVRMRVVAELPLRALVARLREPSS